MHVNERQRTILQDVAEGRLSPEDAAQLLDEAEEARDDEHPDGPAEQRPSAGTAGIQRVRLVQTFRAARVVGDPDVAEAVVEGLHVAEREGDVLVVHGDDVPGAHGFAFSRGDRPWYPSRPERSGRDPRDAGEDFHWWPGSWGSPPGWAGRWGLFDPFHGPLDLSVEAGSLKGSGLLAAGSSRIRCQAGSVKINLERGSSVRVRARTELGKVLLPGDANWIGGSDAAREVTVGDGEALLEIETNMGSVVVSADR
jgi:hypothetical protein